MLLAQQMMEDRIPLAGLSVAPLWVWLHGRDGRTKE